MENEESGSMLPDFYEGGRIIYVAGEVINAKVSLTIDDVHNYLTEFVRGDEIISQIFTGEYAVKSRKTDHYTKDAMDLWNSDRNKVLLILIQETHDAFMTGRLVTSQACARCCKAIIEEPLIPDMDPEKFRAAMDAALIALDLAVTDNLPEIPIMLTYFNAINYNTARFRPDIFLDEVTESTLIKARSLFLENLEMIQKYNP